MKLNKTLLSLSMAAIIGTAATPSSATLYSADFSGLFTWLDGVGKPLSNVSLPYYYDSTWGYGLRTQISGSMTINSDTGTGVASISPFDWQASGPMQIYNIGLQAIGDGMGGSGTLVIGNMLFDWNGNNVVPVEIVWDAAGLFSVGPYFSGQTITGVGSVPASDGIKNGSYSIGAAPIATTTYDTDGMVLTGDDGIGGSLMTTGPFPDSNFNIDITTVTVTSVVPVPAAAWLFGSGLLGLLGFGRRRRAC
jgi:hypothetical protein